MPMRIGHAHLNSTQIYTNVSILKLKEIHAATHPARLERRENLARRTVGKDTRTPPARRWPR